MNASSWRRGFLAAGMLAAAMFGFCKSWGQERAASREPSDSAALGFVREALQAEIDGRSRDRSAYLREAQQQAPDLPAVRWLTGYVRSDNAWHKIDEAGQSLESDPRRVAYLALRAKSPDTLEAHLKLASFCDRKNLAEEQRAHYSRVIDFNPDHLEARQKLGHRRIGDRWWTAEEVERETRRTETLAAGLEAWRGKVEIIAKNWNSPTELRRRVAREQLAAIKDASVVPALEQVLSTSSAEAAWASVEKIAGFQDPEASLSLARHAVLLPWPEVRELAARKLKGRAEDEYVPTLLGAMSTPIESRTNVARGVGGRILYRHEFTREGQSTKQVLVFDTAYRRVEAQGGNSDDTLTRALVEMNMTALGREQQRLRENALIGELNQRIASVLTTTSGEKIPSQPEDCWQWWNDRNEQFVLGGKSTNTVYRVREVEVYDQVPRPDSSTSRLMIPRTTACECLVAGTVVHTSSGLQPIEKVRAGDLVLAQHPRTGEIAFKPVLRTTIRPPEATVRIITAADQIQCTGGHPFWVAGSGWVKARALKSGCELHTLAGPVRVSEVKVDEFAPTYNLIVADFHTYFVGPAKVLSHDNTMRLPTVTAVPGLIEK